MRSVMIQVHRSPWSSGRSRDQVAPPHEVVRRGAQGEHPIDESATAVAKFAKQTDGFHPAEGLLDQLPLPLAEVVSRMARRAPIDRTAAARPMVLRHMGRNA